MYFSEKDANEIIDNIGYCWLKSETDLLYLAVIQDEKCKLKDNYLIERGIKKINLDTSYYIEPITLISLSEIPSYCEVNLKSSLYSTWSEEFFQKNDLNTKINITDEYVDTIESLHFQDLKVRPMVGGIEINGFTQKSKSGTLGAFLTLKHDSSGIFFITNYHNVADYPFQKKSYVFQPNDNMRDFKNYIGEVYIGQYGHHENSEYDLDVAFVMLNNNHVKTQKCSGIENIFTNGSIIDRSNKGRNTPLYTGIKSPSIGMNVKMNGMSTGHKKTKGKIRSINTIVKVTNPYYDETKSINNSIFNNEFTIFRKQLLISNISSSDNSSFSSSGDSGAVVVNIETNEVVGLIHAGDSKNVTIANNIDYIFNNSYPITGNKEKITFNSFIT